MLKAIFYGTFALVAVFSTVNCGFVKNNYQSAYAEEQTKPKLAIVIDDFGYDRKGVSDMLKINLPLTIAVMPGLPYSEADAMEAHEHGHEVILHMPMEAYGNLPESWYGPVMIRNSDTPEKARKTLEGAIDSIPYVNGVNIHMGTAVSQNKKLMNEVLSVTKERNLVFLDSRTIENSVCEEVAKSLNAPFTSRDVFLEIGCANYNTALKEIREAVKVAKQNGKAIAIGHIGSMGRGETARAIKDSIDFITKEVDVVYLSTFK